jgi:hypothetical protein
MAAAELSHDPDDERFACCLDHFPVTTVRWLMSRTRWIWATRRQVRRKFPLMMRVMAATASLVVKSDVSLRLSSGQWLASTNACSWADSGCRSRDNLASAGRLARERTIRATINVKELKAAAGLTRNPCGSSCRAEAGPLVCRVTWRAVGAGLAGPG